MLTLLLFALATQGATQILTVGRIARPAREWIARRSASAGRFVSCPMCLGVWVGAAARLAGLGPVFASPRWLDALAAGCAASSIAWFVHVALHRLGADDL